MVYKQLTALRWPNGMYELHHFLFSNKPLSQLFITLFVCFLFSEECESPWEGTMVSIFLLVCSFFSLLKNLYIFIFIVVQVQLSSFCPHHFPWLHPCPPPTPDSTPPLALSMGPLYMFLDDPSSFVTRYPSPSFPLVTISLFFISMSLVIFYLLVWFVD